MYGFTPIGRIDGKSNFAVREFTNGGTAIAKGDAVKLANGVLATVSANDKILGVAASAIAASVKGSVIVDPYMVYLADHDNVGGTSYGATQANLSPGNYFSLIATTAVQQLDTDTGSATTGEILALSYNPQISPYEADTSVCECMIVGSQHAQGATNA